MYTYWTTKLPKNNFFPQGGRNKGKYFLREHTRIMDQNLNH